MKKITAYGTPDKRRKKKDEEMFYIGSNQLNDIKYAEDNKAFQQQHDRKESVEIADWNNSDQKNQNKTAEAIFII